MAEQPLYPMTFDPAFKAYIWGGRNLETLGRTLPPETIIAESWEIAGHEDGTSTVNNGPYAGQLLTEVHANLGLDLIGHNNAWAQERHKFPLLVKLLDANRPLSVQVHPDDDYALAHEGNELGKTEMWVVLHAEPGAELILGVTRGTTPEAFEKAIAENRLEPFLHRIQVKAGDHVCVPAGTLHAIMGGLIIAEIQQNSNTTYRVYDWGRLDASGHPRPLHIDKAMDVINFDQVETQLLPPKPIETRDGVRRSLLCSNRYFVTERVAFERGASFEGECNGNTLEIWGIVNGTAEIESVSLEAVEFALLPAAMGAFSVHARSDVIALRCYCPG
ncbi:MAG: type I phosphomannose isomerase catalytic subunit [Chloroflexota bacterium]|nr:type I phosphomannose isomerase catalytic subunit [Chloroflexota bacterium]